MPEWESRCCRQDCLRVFGSILQSTNRFPLSPSHVFETTVLHQDGARLPQTPPPFLSIVSLTQKISKSEGKPFFSRAESKTGCPSCPGCPPIFTENAFPCQEGVRWLASVLLLITVGGHPPSTIRQSVQVWIGRCYVPILGQFDVIIDDS
jgi:hypothetical protein